MSHGHVSKLLRQQIARRAKERCGYCLVSALVTGVDLQVEHLWPTSQGGLTVEDNLWPQEFRDVAVAHGRNNFFTSKPRCFRIAAAFARMSWH